MASQRERAVAIKTGGRIEIHAPSPAFNDYATLCGMDGNDPHPHVDQRLVTTPRGAKIDCDACWAIYQSAKKLKKEDFTEKFRALAEEK